MKPGKRTRKIGWGKKKKNNNFESPQAEEGTGTYMSLNGCCNTEIVTGSLQNIKKT